MKISTLLSLGALALTTVIGVAYLSVSVLHIDPRRDYIELTVRMKETGGLMNTSPVELRGIPVGDVTRLKADGNQIVAEIRVNRKYRIPRDSEVYVANLSAAGEQFLAFAPRDSGGPYFQSGDTIWPEQVRETVTVSEVISSVAAVADQLDPDTIDALARRAVAITDGMIPKFDKLAELTGGVSETFDAKFDALARIYVNTQTMLGRSEGFGAQLSEAAPGLPHASESMTHFLRSLHGFAKVGHDAWNDPMLPFIRGLGDWLKAIAPSLGIIGTTLEPYTEKLRDVHVDAGSVLDVLLRAFPEGGGVRVVVN